MNKNGRLFVLIISIVLFLVSVLTLSFAYIGRSDSIVVSPNNTVVQGSFRSANQCANLTATASGSLGLNVDFNALDSSTSSNSYTSYIDSPVVTLTINIAKSSDTTYSNVTCSYMLSYVPTTKYTPSSGAVSAGLMELAVIGSSSSNSFNAVDIGNKTSKTTLKTASITTTSGQPKSEVWSIKMRFYNLDIDQSGIMNQSPKGNIFVEQVSCGGA